MWHEDARVSACLVCGSERFAALFQASDRLYHTTAKKFAVVRCGECGLVRLDPHPGPEELRRYYPDNYWFSPDETAASRMEEAYRRLVLGDHVRFVARALRGSRARGPLLDVGCGGGLFMGMMRERGFGVIGLDSSREAAAIAWRRQQAPASRQAWVWIRARERRRHRPRYGTARRPPGQWRPPRPRGRRWFRPRAR